MFDEIETILGITRSKEDNIKLYREADETTRHLWYALQIDNTDDWGAGCCTIDEAIKRLKASSVYSLIAVIDISDGDGVCID